MQMTRWKKSLSLILCVVLIAAMALFTTGCSDNNQSAGETGSNIAVQSGSVLGEGETEFFLTVTDGEGDETSFTIHTDQKTVGDALLELELIAGEEGAYGLYVKSVNGIAADYDMDGAYCAFYMNGAYAATGVDVTNITAGATYSFKVEKG